MANNLAVGQVVRATAWVTDGPQASANTWFYLVTAVGAPVATDQDMATQFDAAVFTSYSQITNNNCIYRGVQLQIVRPLPVSTAVNGQNNIVAGTAGAIALPKQVAGITSWYTALAGRAGRGRTYWPFPAAADDVGDGTPTAGYTARIAALGAIIQNFTNVAVGGRTATVAMVIFNRTTGVNHNVVVRFSRTVWATQRRMGAYGRSNIAPL